VAFALWGSVAVVHACAFFVARAGATHEDGCFPEGKVAAVGPTSAMI
jgi:hypothetical protein